ncbi:hypothetical protein [Amycolatopsis sp. DSM 110486]|uniref:hypothetical protein n=1 Tax=Amycolatopsis sp. DSM 110486 TaxID=2865832 RepID=UPI001C6A114F|nr:hypothetical protein [Amycolatopsis sp. DSM 110486]QYN17473.1 hypothetical protein K1T34_32320 [Amycolatopsis sp. DSM 110486]
MSDTAKTGANSKNTKPEPKIPTPDQPTTPAKPKIWKSPRALAVAVPATVAGGATIGTQFGPTGLLAAGAITAGTVGGTYAVKKFGPGISARLGLRRAANALGKAADRSKGGRERDKILGSRPGSSRTTTRRTTSSGGGGGARRGGLSGLVGKGKGGGIGGSRGRAGGSLSRMLGGGRGGGKKTGLGTRRAAAAAMQRSRGGGIASQLRSKRSANPRTAGSTKSSSRPGSGAPKGRTTGSKNSKSRSGGLAGLMGRSTKGRSTGSGAGRGTGRTNGRGSGAGRTGGKGLLGGLGRNRNNGTGRNTKRRDTNTTGKKNPNSQNTSRNLGDLADKLRNLHNPRQPKWTNGDPARQQHPSAKALRDLDKLEQNTGKHGQTDNATESDRPDIMVTRPNDTNSAGATGETTMASNSGKHRASIVRASDTAATGTATRGNRFNGIIEATGAPMDHFESATELHDGMGDAAVAVENVGGMLKRFADAGKGSVRLAPGMSDVLDEFNTAANGVAESLREGQTTFKRVHEQDFERIERGGQQELAWDVGRNAR